MSMPPRLRQWVTVRALGWHALFLVIAGGCGIADYWQVQRALGGNGLSWLYVFEWPAFAVVAAIGWWQLVHDTDEDIAERRAYHERMRKASAEVVARTLPRSATALTVSSEEMGNRAIGAGSSVTRAIAPLPGAGADVVASDVVASDVVTGDRAPVLAGEVARLLAPDDDAPADEMTEYNRYLATLAVKGRPKTWRNPRGL
jgi:hypothetical protein